MAYMSLHHGIQVSSSCSDASDRDQEAAVPLDDPYLLKASFMQILKAPVPLALGHFPHLVCLVFEDSPDFCHEHDEPLLPGASAKA